MTSNHVEYIDDDADNFEVKLYIYDLTKGLATSLAPMLIGKQLDGIWHTGIVVYGREYYFGQMGIESCGPGGTMLGQPLRIERLGITEIPYSLFLEYIFGLGETTFKPGAYDLITHNCNNFTNEVSQFLLGQKIPDYITNLPSELLATPLGMSLRPYFESMSIRSEGARGVSFGQEAERRMQGYNPVEATARIMVDSNSELDNGATGVVSSTQKEESSKPAAPKQGEPSKPGKENGVDSDRMSAGVDETSEPESSGDTRPTRIRKDERPRDPPIVYRNVDAKAAYRTLNSQLNNLSGEDQQALAELYEFTVTDDNSWTLGGQHLALIVRILSDPAVSKEGRLSLIKVLQAAALKDDVILLLHMDRKEHQLMDYINTFEKCDSHTQQELAKFLCNLCLPQTASDWLLYISEWQPEGSTWACSNSRVTTRVTVNSLLSENPELIATGVSLLHNLSFKEVFDDTATELASAIVQFIQGDISEEHAFLSLSTLLRLMNIGNNDVPALVAMMEVNFDQLKSKSPRIAELTEQITFKLIIGNFNSGQ